MKKIIMAAGENSQTILLGILVIICIIIVLNMISFFYKKYKNSHFNKNDLTNQIFDEDQSQLYVLVRTKDFKVLFISSRFQEVFHIAKERIVVDFMVLKEMVEERVYRDFMKQYQSWNQENSFKYSFKMKDVDQWFVLTVSAIENGKYHLFAFYDHSEDVLKEKDYLKQIETTKNESEYKASFLSRMSHEIRTPMNGIIGMLTLARNTQDTKQEDYYLQQAQDISQYLLSLINEVLDMSRMEAGKLELENKPFNIYHLEPQLNNIFKETIEKKDVMFKIEYFDFDVKYFVGDELRIMQILVNLLSNASKFTEKGEIKVTFRQMYKEDQVANIMMRVHDTGKGMSREFLSHIFRPFEQEGVEISKKYGGSGLGMAITDQLVKLMGGEIVVDSLEGKGSDFTVFLNLPISTNQQYEDEKEVVVEEFSFDQKRILLAITMIDFDTMIIPDGLNIAMFIVSIVLMYVRHMSLLESIMGMFCISVPMILLNVLIAESFGGGDIKLMFVSGIALGWKYSLLAAFIGILLAGSYSVYLLISKKIDKKGHIAFGPYLSIGIFIALSYGSEIISWYLNLMM